MPDNLTISLAQVALLTGDARLARETLGRSSAAAMSACAAARAPPSRSPSPAPTSATATAAAAPSPRSSRELENPDGAAVLTAYRAFTLWIEERDEEAADAARLMTEPASAAEPTSYRAAVLPAIGGVIAARPAASTRPIARCRAARGARPPHRRALPARARLRPRAYHYEAGDRLERSPPAAIDDAFVRAGYLLGTLFVGAWMSRVQLLLGRRAEALDRLARIDDAARARGLVGSSTASPACAATIRLRQLVEPLPAPAPARRGLYVRARRSPP